MNIVNKSTVISDGELSVMVAACNKLLPDFCAAWGLTVPVVSMGGAGWPFFIVDTAPVQGALAYHTEENGRIDGYVMAKTVLDNSGVKLYKDDHTPTVASALSHELFEALGDRYCNLWVDSSDGSRQFAFENCDPVQDGIVKVMVGDTAVGLSNFVLPSWFNPELVRGRVDYLGALNAPFSITHGGYVTTRIAGGEPTQIFGKETPDWVRQHKFVHGRRRRHHKKM